MRGINNVFLAGHLGQDPELRTTGNGRTLCKISLATNRSVREGEGWKQVTDWHRVVLWERDAETCAKYCRKGSAVGVEGELRVNTWTDATGERRSKVEVVGKRLHLLGKASEGSSRAPVQQAKPEPTEHTIPF